MSQAQAAEAAQLSLRQWKRIEKGSGEVPPETVGAIARALEEPLGRALMRAGYKTEETDIDVEAYLKSMYDTLVVGDLAGALQQFFTLFLKMERGDTRPLKRPAIGMTAEDFVTAALAIERLPVWLRMELIRYVQATEDDGKFDYPLIPALRAELRQQIGLTLRRAVSPADPPDPERSVKGKRKE